MRWRLPFLAKFESRFTLEVGRDHRAIERLVQVAAYQGAAISQFYPNAAFFVIRARQLKFSLIPISDEIEVHARADLSSGNHVVIEVRRVGLERFFSVITFFALYVCVLAAFAYKQSLFIAIPILFYAAAYVVAKFPVELSYFRLKRLFRSVDFS